MKGEVLVVFSVIAISLSDAHYRKKPNIEIFEISENQLTKKLNVQPVKLQYDLESKEKESQVSILSKLLLSNKKKKNNAMSRDIVNKINNLKGIQVPAKKKRQPFIMIVSPEYLDVFDSRYESDQEGLLSTFLDETRSQGLLRPGSEVVFNIVPPKKERRESLKQLRLPAILRNGDGVEDRTNRPPSRSGDRPYDNDYK